jgi:hypothetical protein
MSIHFFDTCAIKHRYIQSKHTSVVRRAVSDARNECHILELTMLEITTPMGAYCRGASLGATEFDRLDRAFMQDVASGRLAVRSFSRRDLQRARHLMRYAGVVKGKNLSSADALVAACCLEFAHERRALVTFWTADKRLHAMVTSVDAFRVLKIRFLPP